jgi:DNA-binding transcriptional MerR regulator
VDQDDWAAANPDTPDGPRWVSAADAADVAGVTPSAVRHWASKGLIVSRQGKGLAGEQILVRLDEVVEQARSLEEDDQRLTGEERGAASSQAASPDHSTPSSDLAPLMKAIPELMAQLTAATDRAARAETKVEFLTEQIASLREEVQTARTVTPAPAPAAPLPTVKWPAAALPDAEGPEAAPEPAAPESPAPTPVFDAPTWGDPEDEEVGTTIIEERGPHEIDLPEESMAVLEPEPEETSAAEPAEPARRESPEELFQNFIQKISGAPHAPERPRPDESFRQGLLKAVNAPPPGSMTVPTWGDEDEEESASPKPTPVSSSSGPGGWSEESLWGDPAPEKESAAPEARDDEEGAERERADELEDQLWGADAPSEDAPREDVPGEVAPEIGPTSFTPPPPLGSTARTTPAERKRWWKRRGR